MSLRSFTELLFLLMQKQHALGVSELSTFMYAVARMYLPPII